MNGAMTRTLDIGSPSHLAIPYWTMKTPCVDVQIVNWSAARSNAASVEQGSRYMCCCAGVSYVSSTMTSHCDQAASTSPSLKAVYDARLGLSKGGTRPP